MLALQLAILAFHMAAAPLLLPVFHMQQAQAPLQQLRVATQARARRVVEVGAAQLVQTVVQLVIEAIDVLGVLVQSPVLDRKSTRLNSSHVASSYAVFCLKKTSAVW